MNKEHPTHEDRFYEKKLGACPLCGDTFAENKALRMSKLNSQLYGQIEQTSGGLNKEHAAMTKKIKKEAFG